MTQSTFATGTTDSAAHVTEAPPYLDHQYIAGWRTGSSSRSLDVHNPFTGQLVTSFPMATVEDVDRAYQAAADSQGEWAAAPASQRRDVIERARHWLMEHGDEVREYLVREGGGTRSKAEFEFGLAIDLLHAAEAWCEIATGEILPSPEADRENRLDRLPVGVVGVISPFNAPFFLSLKAVVPALALGNAVVLKPHELTPVAGGTLIAHMFAAAGLPAGVLNVVVTDIAEVGDSLVEHPIPSAIAFTGSAATGRHIAEVAGRHLKKVVLELGGNSAFVVLHDADLDLAVGAGLMSRFIHSGQVCMAANRFIVHADVYDEFLDRFIAGARALTIGDPDDPATMLGPLISAHQAQLLDSQVETAVARGARLALGTDPRRADDALYPPVVLAEVTEDNPVAQQELFGPVACFMRARDDDDAVRLANATPYGLSGAVFTRDLARGVRVAQRIRTGMVHVNDATVSDQPAVPFGGVGASGHGRLNGRSSIEAFTYLRWTRINRGAFSG
ncbi:MAG TPA: aldehyde dehydrogenase family protein [Jiangellaceae bacterium]